MGPPVSAAWRRALTDMNLKSLGYRTDLIFPSFDGEIIDRGDYLVVRSPLNPTFYWGNFLLFARPPQAGDFERWRDVFSREIGDPPAVEHQAFGWDGTDGEVGMVEPFVRAGFGLERNVTLTTGAPRPPMRPAENVVVRELDLTGELETLIALQVLCRDEGHDEAGYRLFRQDAMRRYGKMEAAGLGHWYAAFLDGQLVADLGVFHDGRGLGRYQAVETHPDYRRQGIAGTLVYEAGRRAIAGHKLHTLVIVAEDDSSPSRLYQSVGFEPTEKSAGVLWWEGRPKDAAWK